MRPKASHLTLGLAFGSVWLLSGCASGPSPTPQLTRAEVAIDEADEARAGELAPASLALARDKYARAEDAAGRGENQTAIRLAELAEAEARAARSEQNLAEVRQGVGALREDTLQ